MKVKMRIPLSGTRDGQAWPGVGEEVDLPDDEAAEMCARGHAEPVAANAEKATAARPETRSKK